MRKMIFRMYCSVPTAAVLPWTSHGGSLTAEEAPLVEQALRKDFDLSDYVWKNRVLLAFAPSRTAEPLTSLRRSWMAQIDEVAERDLMLVEVLQDSDSRAGGDLLSASPVASLRNRFAIEPGRPTFILVGKDGTVKLRSTKIRMQQLFEVIDAMPMRRADMLRNGSSL
jgi:hypothetical protein